ncbi:MAG: hypothetical protein AAGD12_02075, partial [Pseudomonadota bacterium]
PISYSLARSAIILTFDLHIALYFTDLRTNQMYYLSIKTGKEKANKIMNQNHIQSYINLIQKLLSTPTEKTAQILASNQELLDKGLLQTITMVAQKSGEKGNQEVKEILLCRYQRSAARHLHP